MRICGLLGASAVGLAGSIAATGPSSADDLMLVLENRSSHHIVGLYAAPSDFEVWAEEVLGAQALPAGSATAIVLANGQLWCDYDLRFIFETGEEFEDFAVDLCQNGTYTLYD